MKKLYLMLFMAAVTLTLYSCGSSGTPTAVAKLENTKWKLVKVNGISVSGGTGKKQAFIIFNSSEKRFTGSGGCNNMFGSYSKSGSDLSIGPVARTEMFCEGVMDTEENFVRALGKNAKYRIKGNMLSLIDSAGTVTANLTAE